MSLFNIICNRRLLTIFMLGFASGLPLALTGATLMAWFTEAQVDLHTVGALTLLGIPYTLKFLWAPLMDCYCFFNKLGKRKSWIIITQAGLIIALLLISNMDPSRQAGWVCAVALLIAFFSASQDISINAYTTEILLPSERGLGAAYTVFAYRIALLVSGGLALILADYWGWRTTYQLMALLTLFLMLGTYFAPPINENRSNHNHLYLMIKTALLEILQRDKALLIILFVIFYKFGDALALSLMTNFLLQGLHFTLTEIGIAYKVVSMVAVILGGLVGGIVLIRMPLFRALLIFGLMQAFSNLLFAWLALAGKHFALMSISVFIENFCSGLSTAALLALLMSLCHQPYTASQFALYSATASFARVFLGPLAAWMVQEMGWAQFYVWSFILCFPGILLLTLLKSEVWQHAPAAID